MGYVEKDFLMRQFNQLGVVLAKILGFKEKGKFEEAEAVIDNALTDFDLKELNFYSAIHVDSLIPELIKSHHSTMAQINVLAEMMYEKAEIKTKLGKTDIGKELYIRALKLFEYITDREKIFSFEREEKIKKIKSLLGS
jgi:hypothetical protein